MTSTAHRAAPTSGWLTFAGLLLILVGASHLITGMAALWKDDYLLATDDGLLVFDLTSWGWIWLLIGAFQLLIGICVCLGQSWARAFGVLFALLAVIGQFAYLAAYPVWSVLGIALCVLALYALVVPSRGSVGA